MNTGDIIDDYCTRCHRLTNHAVAALIAGGVASTTCRTCGFQHPYRGGKVPARTSKTKTSAFDQVLAGILASEPQPDKPVPPPRPRKKRLS